MFMKNFFIFTKFKMRFNLVFDIYFHFLISFIYYYYSLPCLYIYIQNFLKYKFFNYLAIFKLITILIFIILKSFSEQIFQVKLFSHLSGWIYFLSFLFVRCPLEVNIYFYKIIKIVIHYQGNNIIIIFKKITFFNHFFIINKKNKKNENSIIINLNILNIIRKFLKK